MHHGHKHAQQLPLVGRALVAVVLVAADAHGVAVVEGLVALTLVDGAAEDGAVGAVAVVVGGEVQRLGVFWNVFLLS